MIMTILSAAVLLGVLIFVHEFGHFFFAKLVGVKVLKFSLGFGPRVIGKTVGETEYCISAVPLGGYVKMLGQEDMPDTAEEIPEAEKHRAYNFQPVWKRFLIVFVGPLFNILFAVLVFSGIFMKGVPLPLPEIGKLEENSAAVKAGLATGDRVTTVNGKPVQSFVDIEEMVADSEGRQLVFQVARETGTATITVAPEKKTEKTLFGEDKQAWDIGAWPLMYPVAGSVMKNSRAEKAGLQSGDRITAIDNAQIKTWQDMTKVIHDNPEKEMDFTIQRKDGVHHLRIAPEKNTIKAPNGEEKTIGLIGIKPAGNDFIRHYGVAESLSLGVKRTWDLSVITLLSIVKLVQRVIPADTIGGPIMIAQMAGEQASQGAVSFFTLMAVISINLGVLNLLPIPILDGGHLLFLGIEAVRRKPVSEKVVVMAQKVGLALLVMLMGFAIYNDILRWITGRILPR